MEPLCVALTVQHCCCLSCQPNSSGSCSRNLGAEPAGITGSWSGCQMWLSEKSSWHNKYQQHSRVCTTHNRDDFLQALYLAYRLEFVTCCPRTLALIDPWKQKVKLQLGRILPPCFSLCFMNTEHSRKMPGISMRGGRFPWTDLGTRKSSSSQTWLIDKHIPGDHPVPRWCAPSPPSEYYHPVAYKEKANRK